MAEADEQSTGLRVQVEPWMFTAQAGNDLPGWALTLFDGMQFLGQYAVYLPSRKAAERSAKRLIRRERHLRKVRGWRGSSCSFEVREVPHSREHAS